MNTPSTSERIVAALARMPADERTQFQAFAALQVWGDTGKRIARAYAFDPARRDAELEQSRLLLLDVLTSLAGGAAAEGGAA